MRAKINFFSISIWTNKDVINLCQEKKTEIFWPITGYVSLDDARAMKQFTLQHQWCSVVSNKRTLLSNSFCVFDDTCFQIISVTVRSDSDWFESPQRLSRHRKCSAWRDWSELSWIEFHHLPVSDWRWRRAVSSCHFRSAELSNITASGIQIYSSGILTSKSEAIAKAYFGWGRSNP